MPYYRKCPCILCVVFINFALLSLIPAKRVPEDIASGWIAAAGDTTSISIDPKIKDSFPNVFALLQQLISDTVGIFRERDVSVFFNFSGTRLVFSAKTSKEDVGGYSDKAEFRNGYFRDTIFLNERYFENASKEYMIAVVVHEVVHAFVTWGLLLKQVDLIEKKDAFYKTRFPHHWRWLRRRTLSERRQHILMSENFIGMMDRCLYVYTSDRLSRSVRNSIADALTWDGLTDTRRWWNLGDDTCRFVLIDYYSRHLNVTDTIYHGSCRGIDTGFLHSLHLSPLCPQTPNY
jgi:hypothetical protein